eukprot:4263903-Pyramimonas_sp.AAC.2
MSLVTGDHEANHVPLRSLRVHLESAREFTLYGQDTPRVICPASDHTSENASLTAGSQPTRPSVRSFVESQAKPPPGPE